MSDIKCTSCSSTEFQKLSMVYASGTSKIDARTKGKSTGTGIGFGPGGASVGFGVGSSSSRTQGTQMTELAKQAAPPKKKLAFGWVVIGLTIFVVLVALNAGAGAIGFLLLLGCGFFAWRGFSFNASVYPGLRADWDKSWMCHRCGTIFAA